MTEERLMRRLRAAAPVIIEPAGADELFAQIIARPVSAEAAGNRPGGVPRWVAAPRRLSVGVAAFLLLAGSATAAVISTGVFAHDTPVALFSADQPHHASLLGQPETVIPATVKAADTFTVPGVGQISLWTGTTSQNGICTGMVLPGTTWAGFGASPYDTGGAQAGCEPTYAQVDQNAEAHGGNAILELDGFQYSDATLQGTDGRSWEIEYGRITPPQGQAVTVRDEISGVSAPVTAEGWFAITLPMGSASTPPQAQLQALDSSGQVIAQEPNAS